MNKSKRPDALDRAAGRLIDGCRLGPGLTAEEETERRRLRREIERFERKYPALAAREDEKIRRRVLGRERAVEIKAKTQGKSQT